MKGKEEGTTEILKKKKKHKKREVKNKVGREIMKRDRKDKACWSK